MKAIQLFYLYLVVVLAQLYIPAKMILDREDILKTGKAFKFKTQPVDPSDPFKGKYIYLNLEASIVPSNDSTWTRQELVYVVISEDDAGFVVAKHVSRKQPEIGIFVKAKVEWYDSVKKMLIFSYPFNEFYMNEAKAYDAEIAHLNAQTDSTTNTTYALVYVKNGDAVLSNVFINEIPIADYIELE